MKPPIADLMFWAQQRVQMLEAEVAFGESHQAHDLKRMREVLATLSKHERAMGALREIAEIAREAERETLAADGAPGWTSVCAIEQKARAALDTAETDHSEGGRDRGDVL